MTHELFIANLGQANEGQLREHFAPIGSIVSARVIMDRQSGRSKGFGFVEMESEEAVADAIAELDGSSLAGSKIVVKKTNGDKPARSGGRDMNGGGDRDGRGDRGSYGNNNGNGNRNDMRHNGDDRNNGYRGNQRNFNSGGYNSRPNPHARSRMNPRKLDPTLFIKKAKEMEISQEPLSTMSFSDYAIVDILKRNIVTHGYVHPTTIQEKAIPEILAGRDVIGVANTGTGKTAAFLISLINKCFNDRSQRVLIVVPTRELAIQIADEFQIFADGMNLEAVAIVGGANIRRQTQALRRRPHFVIGTPGRLQDLIRRRELDLRPFQNIVLDEVDRMVDIGFREDITYLVSLLPSPRQSLFFSATVDGKTKDILSNFVKDPVTVSVKKHDTVENIEQNVVRVTSAAGKIEMLHDLLIKPDFNKVIIFGRTKRGVEKLDRELKDRGFKSAAIHGNKSQHQRQKALSDFKSNTHQILIATDVASRGIDIDDVTHVINYDAPTSYDDYVHRIGRTGRAGKRGVALTFVE